MARGAPSGGASYKAGMRSATWAGIAILLRPYLIYIVHRLRNDVEESTKGVVQTIEVYFSGAESDWSIPSVYGIRGKGSSGTTGTDK